MMLPDSFFAMPLAHRALHDVADGRPENSVAAIEAAMAAGFGIEIDVQLSADNEAMVFHDYALDRLTSESGAVRQHRADWLRAIPLKGGDGGIPILADVLAMIDGKVPLVIELKDQDGAMGTDLGPLETAVSAAIKGYQGDLAVMSFNPHSVALMQTLSPQVPRGIVTSAYRYADWPLPKRTCDQLRNIPDYDRVGACFISHEVDDLASAPVAAIKAKGAMICCWTVRSAAQEDVARQIADNITFEGYLPRSVP